MENGDELCWRGLLEKSRKESLSKKGEGTYYFSYYFKSPWEECVKS